MTWGTFFVGMLLLIIVGLIIASMVRQKKENTECPGACYACPMARKCPRAAKPNPLKSQGQ